MSFWTILTIYVLPPLLALIGAFFGVLFGSAITIRFFKAKQPTRPIPTSQRNGGRK